MRALKLAAVFGCAALLLPTLSYAFPFGGQASVVLPCVYNSTIYANVGPPRGGEYIWTTATKTYQFGPPSHAGQWLLGLAGAPYYCIFQIDPLTVYSGISITMMGSSGSAAPTVSLGGSPNSFMAPSGSPGSGSQTGASTPPPPAGHVLISEVFFAVDTAHGTKPLNEWVELYNPTTASVNVSGWTMQRGTVSSAILQGVSIAPNTFVVVTGTSTTRTLWNIPATTQVVSLGQAIEGGLANAGDGVILKTATGVFVDSVSWGTSAIAFSPSVPAVLYGHSIARSSPSTDTDTASDWIDRAAPTPGR